MLSKAAIVAVLVALSYAQLPETSTRAPETAASRSPDATASRAPDATASPDPRTGGECALFHDDKDVRICMRAHKCQSEAPIASMEYEQCMAPMKWIGKPQELAKLSRHMEKIMRELWGCLDDEWKEKVIDEQRNMLKKAKKGLEQCMEHSERKKMVLMHLFKMIGMHFNIEPAESSERDMDNMDMGNMDMDMLDMLMDMGN